MQDPAETSYSPQSVSRVQYVLPDTLSALCPLLDIAQTNVRRGAQASQLCQLPVVVPGEQTTAMLLTLFLQLLL